MQFESSREGAALAEVSDGMERSRALRELGASEPARVRIARDQAINCMEQSCLNLLPLPQHLKAFFLDNHGARR